jgi:HSP20 family protein
LHTVIKMSDEKKKPDEKKDIVTWNQKELFKAFDDMFNDLRRSFMLYPRDLREAGWPSLPFWTRSPLTDMIDKGDHYEVHMDIPGITKDKLQIDVTSSGAEVNGESVEEEQTKDKDYMMRERRSSSIHRRISFPEEVLPHEATAEVNDGVLVLSVPKKKPAPAEEKHRVKVK